MSDILLAFTVLNDVKLCSYPENEVARWSSDDLPMKPDLKLVGICRERWSFTSGHVLSRDIVIVEKT
jgi:hypothetical protein